MTIRWPRIAGAVLLALALSVVLVVLTADGPDAVSGGLGGDYPSFYAAGDIVLHDAGLAPDDFYDPDTQFEAQAPVLPSDEDGHLYFGYPAFFVAPFVPLAALDFRWSYLVDVVLMTAAAVGALHLLKPCSRVVREHWIETLAVALTFFPLFRGISGGQNTAVSLLLVAWIWRSLHDEREIPAGIAAGLLLFKPPLALPFLGVFLLARRYRAVLAGTGTAVVLYLVGAALTGPSWPSAWVDAVRYLDRVDTPFNVQNFVSLPGAAEAIFGIDSGVAAAAGFGLGAIVAIAVVWPWLRGIGDVGPRVAMTAAGALLISPHALYYDAGLLVLVGIVLADRSPAVRRWLPLLWAAGFLQFLADPLGVTPIAALVVVGFVLAYREVLAPAAVATATSPAPAAP